MSWMQDVPSFVSFVLALGWIVSIYFIKKEYARIWDKFYETEDGIEKCKIEINSIRRELNMDIEELKNKMHEDEKFTQQVLHELELLEVELGKKTVKNRKPTKRSK